MKRRGFVKLCAAAVAGITAAAETIAGEQQQYRRYGRVALVDPDNGRPVRAASLEVGETYVFHYPFISTPCFLVDLGKTVEARTELRTHDGAPYVWRGGAGPKSSVVAFSAICAHKMTHPARAVSFINYRHGETRPAVARYWAARRRSRWPRSSSTTGRAKMRFTPPRLSAAKCSIAFSAIFTTGWYSSTGVLTSTARCRGPRNWCG